MSRLGPARGSRRRASFGPARDLGFTLLELIVAAGILALIAVFSWRGLDTLIREREAIAASQATIDALQRAFARVERDALRAGDAQIDEDGTVRLAAGTSSIGGEQPAAVEYRVRSGTLTRRVIGVDPAPQALLDGIAALAVEAWTPAAPPRGGAWVRVKAAATEAPPPPVNGGAAAASSGGAPVAGSSFPSTPANGSPVLLGANGVPPGSPSAPAVRPGGPVVVAATGLRLSLARQDGSKVVRTFLIGGG